MFEGGFGRGGLVAGRVFWVLVLVVALVGSVSVVSVGRAVAAPSVGFDVTLGGSGRIETYPSGLEVGSDGSVVSADTGADRVVKYNADGSRAWVYGSFGSAADGGLSNPRDVGIDSVGNVYVADTGNGRIIKLNASGGFEDVWTAVNSPMGVTVSGDVVYVADAGVRLVRMFDTDGNQTDSFGEVGACVFDAIRDVDAASNGDVYIANYLDHNVLHMSSTGECLGQWGSQGEGVGEFKAPYGVRVAVDPFLGESVYVADSNNDRVQVFDLAGTYVDQFGSTGVYNVPGTHTELRRVAVASDGSGDVWTADLWGWRLQRFDRTAGGWLSAQTIGGVAPLLTDSAVFNEVRQIGFAADGSFWAADTVHHRFVHMSAAGAVLGSCGVRGWDPGEFNWPESVAVDHGSGDLWVTDTKQSRLQVLSDDCSGPVFVGGFGSGLGEFYWPTSVVIRQADGVAFVVDRKNNRVVSYDVASRAPIEAYVSPGLAFDNPRRVALDPGTGNLYVADTKNNRIVELSDVGGADITQVRVLTPGLDAPEGVAVGGDGTIYVADTGNDRVVVLDADGTVADTLTDGFYAPGSLSIGPDDRLYVSDTHNDRIQTYTTTTGVPDVVPPVSVIVSPASGSTVIAGVVPLTGSATDNASGVAVVEVSLMDRATNLWWDPGTSSWGSFGWFDASLSAPGSTSTGWSVDFAAGSDGDSYWLQARAIDASGNIETDRPGHVFSAEAGIVPDVVPPVSVIVSPGAGSSVPVGVVPLTGSATDDASGVASVEVSVQDVATSLWWDPGTSSWGSFGWFDASLSAPGSTSTGWSVDFAAGVDGESYQIEVRATDRDGNVEVAGPGHSFSVEASTVPDTTRPDTTYTEPLLNAVLPNGLVTLAGGATDNRGVAEVELTLKDRITGLWWNPTTTSWGGYTRFNATVDSPGAIASSWSYDLETVVVGGSGSFWSSARAVDTSGNTDIVLPSTRFRIAADDVSPGTTYVSPLLNEVMTPGIVPLSGTATDNAGVARVEVALNDRVRRLWWNPATQTWGAFTRFAATLTDPGGTSTQWSVDIDETAADAAGGSGAYWSSARAVDGAGNVDLSPASTRFTVQPDTGAAPSFVGVFAGEAVAGLTPVDVASFGEFFYVIDVARYRVVKVDRVSGVVVGSVGGERSTLPGGIAAARAIAVDSVGNVYVADTPNAWIQKFDGSLGFVGYWGEKGDGAEQFDQVYGVAVGVGKDAGGVLTELLYTVDGDGRLKKWGLDGSLIGDFSVGVVLDQPRQVEVHPVTNDVWLVNSRAREIVVIDVDGVERFRFGSEGSGPGEFLGDPRGITISADGSRVFVADDGNHRVQVFDDAGVFVESLGGVEGDADYLVDVRGLDATADGRLIVSDEWDFDLKEFSTAGSYVRSLFGASAPLGGVNSPRGLGVDSLGRVYVSDWWNQRVGRWDSDGSDPFMWGFRGTVAEPGSVNFAWDVVVQPGTDRVFLANRESHEIEVFEADGSFVTRWGTRGVTDGRFEFPQGVAFAPDGTLVVTDSGNGRVQRFAIGAGGGGTFVESFGSEGTLLAGELNLPAGVSVGDDGVVWVADTRNNRVQSYDPSTSTWTVFAAASGLSNFSLPWGVTVAPDGTVWVADSGRDRIVKMLVDGTAVFAATGPDMGAGDLNSPHAIAFGLDGAIYISDIWNNRIIEINE